MRKSLLLAAVLFACAACSDAAALPCVRNDPVRLCIEETPSGSLGRIELVGVKPDSTVRLVYDLADGSSERESATSNSEGVVVVTEGFPPTFPDRVGVQGTNEDGAVFEILLAI